jgi:molybdenum cofactor synthesis domain-containing protein
VVTVSNRAAAGVYEDTAGPVLVAGLREAGLDVDGPQVVRDGDPVGAALRAAVAAGYDVVVTTGGTGLNPHDATPEQTAPLLDRQVPGIAEALRAVGLAKGVPTAVLSRGLAGMAGRTLVVNVAGSPGACRDAVGLLSAVLPHAVDQRRGGDHPRA